MDGFYAAVEAQRDPARDQLKIDEDIRHLNELTPIPVLKAFFKDATTTRFGWLVVVGFAGIIPALMYGMSVAAFLMCAGAEELQTGLGASSSLKLKNCRRSLRFSLPHWRAPPVSAGIICADRVFHRSRYVSH